MVCPQCRAEVSAGARFCASCGHELVVVGDQRRIATVVFADLVGFTAMSETLDPEQVKRLVDRCFERLARDIDAFGGRVDKVMGDAIVALFGAPVAHEDDAERAVRAGLRMQETIAAVAADIGEPVRMRVGVNTGEVLVGAVRAGREYTAMGDVVNTASRLQEAATPGTVLVGPDTRLATRNAIEYRRIDPVEAKGKRLPVEAFEAVRPVAPPGQRVRTARMPLVGRDAELSLLTGVSETAIERSRAALLVVHGEAGMGKSRLAAEAAAHAGRCLGALVLEGRCVPYGEANVWWPVAEAVLSAAGLDPSATPEDAEDHLRRAATTALTESGRLDEVDRVVAGLQHLLGNDGPLRDIDGTRAREEVIRSVVAITEGYTRQKPVMVVLSDLHWADQEVLDLLDTLLARLARRPFVLLATARRSLRDRWTPTPEAANSVVLHLDPLDDEASSRLLGHLTEGALHPALAALLVDRSGGNPFYLEELVSLITDAGVRTVDQLLQSEAGDLPTTLRGLVAARLDALGPEDRHVLDDAAVLGRSNKIDALLTMAKVKRGHDRERTRSILESLAAREFLVLDGAEYSFRSDVIREVAYSTLTKSDRARSHAGIAQWIEAHEDAHHEYVIDQVAHHWASAAELVADVGPTAEVPADVVSRAIEWILRGIDVAQDDVFPTMVATLATRGLGLVGDDDPRRIALLRHRAAARADTYDLDGAEADAAAAEELAAAAGDEQQLAQLLLVRADVFQHRGRLDDALAALADAERRFAAFDDVAGRAETLRKRGMAHLFAAEFDAADEALSEAVELFERLGDRRGTAWAFQNLAWSAYIAGRVEESEQRVLAAMRTFEELGDPGGLTWSRGLLAWVRFHQGRNEEAEALAAEVGLDARERGEVWGEAMMVVLTASIALWSGRTDHAVQYAREATRLFEEIDDRMGELQARCGLARSLLMSGDIDAGIDQLHAALWSRSEQDANDVWMARVITLTSAVQLGDVELGRNAIAESQWFRPADLVGGADATAALALHHLQAGDDERAAAVAAEITEDRGYVHCARALVAATRGDADEVTGHLTALERGPHTYLDEAYGAVARALVDAAHGRVDEARGVLGATITAVDGTGDRLAQAVLRLVDATVAEHGRCDDAGAARDSAEGRLQLLGVRADGWRRLLHGALGAVAVS